MWKRIGTGAFLLAALALSPLLLVCWIVGRGFDALEAYVNEQELRARRRVLAAEWRAKYPEMEKTPYDDPT